MSRTDFNALAAALSSCKNLLSRSAHRIVCEAVADHCAARNPRFDRVRFLAACDCEAAS